MHRANILILSETWVNNDEEIHMPNFNCVVKFKNSGRRAGGTAIFHNNNDSSHIVTSNMDIDRTRSESLTVRVASVGELCAADCLLENGQKIVSVFTYMLINV